MRWGSFLVLFGVLLFAVCVYGASLEQADFPSLNSSLKALDNLDLCGERVPLEIQEVRERMEKQLMLSLWSRPQVMLWLKRSRRYLPHIEKMLKESGMPDDLKYVAIAESALRPHAGSRKGAIGFWQFMSFTGKMYGLVINRRIDERRNLFASTRAAIGYLKNLHEKFGSWTLAVAAHNMGDEGLRIEIMEQKTNNYYQLYLPLETQQFIFRILSVKLIFSDPEKFGFKLDEEDYYPPLEFDEIQVECSRETPIRIIAQAANTHFKAIKDLNPEIRGHYLATGSHRILIPKGASTSFQGRYQDLVDKFSEIQTKRTYVIKRGDSLSTIADKFRVPIADLILWNRLDPTRPIHPGDRLIIYQTEEKSD
jgi:hypothetical protein